MDNLITYIAAILILVFLMILWVVIQGFWRRTFDEHISDPDVLAGRRNCGNCGCTTICENKKGVSTNNRNA